MVIAITTGAHCDDIMNDMRNFIQTKMAKGRHNEIIVLRI